MRRILLATLLALLLLPSLSYAATQKPAFFDSIKSQKDMDALSDAQRTELRAYLSASALETPGTVIGIDSLNLSLDKPSYTKGDQVTIALSLTSPMAKGYADTHKGTKDAPILTATLGLVNQDGTTCIDPLEKTFPITDLVPTFQTTATADCDHPKASISLSDWNQTDLGAWTINTPGVIVKPETTDQNQTVPGTPISTKTGIIAIVVVLSIIALGLIATRQFGRKKGRRGVKGRIIMPLILLGSFLSLHQVQAVVNDNYPWKCGDMSGASLVRKMTPGTYPWSTTPHMCATGGTPSPIDSTGLGWTCTNSGIIYDCSAYLDGGGGGGGCIQSCPTTCGGGGEANGCGGTCSPRAACSGGVNGACSSSIHSPLYNLPATNLCDAGTYNGYTTYYDSWTWTCFGSDRRIGTTNASCSAYRIVDGVCGALNTSSIVDGSFPGSPRLAGLCDKGTTPNSFAWPESLTPWYRWKCFGINGGLTVDCWASVIYLPHPAFTLTATPTSVVSGNASKLTWSAPTNATSCTASASPVSTVWSATTPTSAALLAGNPTTGVSTGALAAAETYTMSCTGPGGTTSHSATVAVTVPTPAPTFNFFTATPTTIPLGSSTTLDWSTNNATSCTPSASPAQSGWTANGGAVSGTQVVTPTTIGVITYTLNCTGPGGSVGPRSVAVTVTDPSTLRLCQNGFYYASGGSSGLNITLVQGEYRNLTTYYDAASGCPGTNPVTSSTTFASSKPAVGVLSGTDPKKLTGDVPNASTTNGQQSDTSNITATYNGKTVTMPITVTENCVSRCAEQATNYCQGTSFPSKNSCNEDETCQGTRSCDQNWKEVAPTGN